MKRKVLFFVRHGETDYNQRLQVQGRGIDASLNSKGQQQALALASRLAKEPFDFVACSTLKRAIQTTEYVVKYHSHLEINKYTELDELWFGDWEGKTWDPKHPENISTELNDLLSAWKQGKTNLGAPNGECPLDAEQRALKVIKHILDQDIQHALLIAHGRLLKVILCSLLKKGLHNMHEFQVDNTSVNVLEYDGETFTPVLLNGVDHLHSELLEI